MTTTKTRKLTPIPDALATVTIPEAVEALHELERRFDLIPVAARTDIADQLHRIITTGESLYLTGASQLVTEQRALLTALTSIANPTAFHNSTDSDQLHTSRNLLLTLALAATHVHGWNHKGLLERAVSMAQRTCRQRRPFTDDEVLLTRLMAIVTLRTDPKSPLPALYALVEAGMTPGETSQFRCNDLDDAEHPTHVVAAGNRIHEARFLPLDRFAAQILTSTVAKASQQGLKPHETALYRGKTNLPGTPAATASVQGVLNRFLKDLGLHLPDVSASGIRKWRLERVYNDQGAQTALVHAGYGPGTEDMDRLWLHLDLTTPLADTSTEPDDDEHFLD
ncbi:hypothetical protein [Janibacter sp. DB-40]|uniref:hypothetical protein n=1 Tax=Janibacter sp. DB-40 TaxID=3028808 RepID=UPI002404B61E|nr:hypothetical protein [Janibacter sp. DB-40]